MCTRYYFSVGKNYQRVVRYTLRLKWKQGVPVFFSSLIELVVLAMVVAVEYDGSYDDESLVLS